jgi:hypothetical protein
MNNLVFGFQVPFLQNSNLKENLPHFLPFFQTVVLSKTKSIEPPSQKERKRKLTEV